MDMKLNGETALILGGSKGLALACARALADEGVAVVLNGRDTTSGEAAARELGSSATFVGGDLHDAASREAVVERACSALGHISILVTNAGGPPTGEFNEQRLDAWRHALEINMLAAIDIAQRLLPSMTERGFGRIVNITSFAVKEPYPNMALSNGVRAGLTGAMATLAREVIDKRVTVNNILPGLMDTGALERVIRARSQKEGVTEQEARDQMAASVPAKRLGTAEEFGPLCAFLCSRHAGYITGQNITVDGGLVRGLL